MGAKLHIDMLNDCIRHKHYEGAMILISHGLRISDTHMEVGPFDPELGKYDSQNFLKEYEKAIRK